MTQIILNVTLPEALEAYVNERVAEAGHGSPSDYIRTPICEDKERRARETLDRLLLAGLDSESDPVTPDYLTELRREGKHRVTRRRKDLVQLVSTIDAEQRNVTTSGHGAEQQELSDLVRRLRGSDAFGRSMG